MRLSHGSERITKHLEVNPLRQTLGTRKCKCNTHNHCIIGVDEFLKGGRIATLRCNNQLRDARIYLVNPQAEFIETGSWRHFSPCNPTA